MKLIQTLPILLLLLASGCGEDTGHSGLRPVASFRMTPADGNTTTIFSFNADSVTGQGTRNNPVLVRWDWESDSIWDGVYSTGGKITHRFFKPGTYQILMEASTVDGQRDTASRTLEVVRGYSPPRADFSMDPDSANITHEFTFDASLSKDDEDSLDQLRFRWDFDGDLNWDTDFSSTPFATHRYTDGNRYPVRLEVIDPQDMTSIRTRTLIVNRLNDLIVPAVTHECWPCTLEDTVVFDGSSSNYIGQPDEKLTWSWDAGNDNIWEVVNSTDPVFKAWFGREGKVRTRMRVTDESGLYMEIVDTVELYPLNSAPNTVLTIANPIGNTGTQYSINLQASSDRDDSFLDLQSRWDVNNDGIWDSQYDGLFDITLTFTVPGKYPVTAMLTDPKGKFTTDTDTVWVVAGNHETGILSDRRGTFLPVYYGIVRIGDRWWMQSNLKYNPSSKDAEWHSCFYNNNPANEERYGALYPQVATISQRTPACPTGWHVPSLAEWQQLMTDLGQDTTIGSLLEGGRSELHFLLAGQKDRSASRPGQSDQFSGLGLITNIWTSDVNRTGQAYAWYIDPVRRQNRYVIVGKNYWFPIRCIRDE
jgi:uncharacterized protein (TIGR02145 family)